MKLTIILGLGSCGFFARGRAGCGAARRANPGSAGAPVAPFRAPRVFCARGGPRLQGRRSRARGLDARGVRVPGRGRPPTGRGRIEDPPPLPPASGPRISLGYLWTSMQPEFLRGAARAFFLRPGGKRSPRGPSRRSESVNAAAKTLPARCQMKRTRAG